MTEYSSNPMNLYSIMSKKEIKKNYPKIQNINAFLTKQYLMTIYANYSLSNNFWLSAILCNCKDLT